MALSRRTILGVAGLVFGSGGAVVATVAREDSLSEGDVSLSKAEATEIATDEVSGTVKESELEREDGTPVYEFEIEREDGTVTEVVVHADEGDLLEVENEDNEDDDDEEDDDEDDDDEETIGEASVTLTEDEAADTATNEVSGTVQETELEREDGTPVYEIEITGEDGTESEVVVHADEGTVLGVETRKEDDAEEA